MKSLLPFLAVLRNGAAMACDDDDTVVQPDGGVAFPVFQIATPGPALSAAHVVGSRRAEEEAALARLHPKIRAELDRPDVRAVSSSNAETARLISTIYEIRAADARARSLEESRRTAEQFGSVVTIALIDNMPTGGARAMVLRRASVEPRDVILLPREDAAASSLSDAIRVLSRMREAHGDNFEGDARVVVPPRSGVPSAATLGPMTRHLEKLRKVGRSNLPGIGEASAIQLRLGPVRPGNIAGGTP
jgi:hypothetical protein